MKKLFLVLAIIFFSEKISAQVCGGSFGAPIFNETFGSSNTTNQTISGPLPSSYTNYNYSSVFPPNDGWYTISNTTEWSSWGWPKYYDHTTNNGLGNMLVVNADYNAGEFYRRTISGLCPNQVYRFSAWILNIHKAGANIIKPNVTFKITTTSGVLIGKVDTGDLPEDATQTWRNFYLDFVSDPTSTSVDVVLINNAPGGIGNDLAIDDITFSPCGPATAVNTNISTIFTAGVCDNSQNLKLTAQLLPNTFQTANFIWQKSTDNGATWVNVTSASANPDLIILAGTYQNNDQYRFIVGESTNISSSNCQVFSNPAILKINGYPNPPNPQTFDFCEGTSKIPLSISGSNILWYTTATGGTGTFINPTIDTSILGTQNFWVAQIANGCESLTRSKITANVSAYPTKPQVSNISYCQDEVATALSATGNNLLWYTTATGGTGASTAPIPNTLVAGVFSFWVSQSNNSCESARAEIKVAILPKPFSTKLSDQSICDDEEATLDAGSGFSAYEWNTSPKQFSQSIKVKNTGVYEVTLTGQNGCKAKQSATVYKGTTPEIVNIVSGKNYLKVEATGGNPPYFYSLDDINWQTSNIFENLKPGIYTIYVKSQIASCTTSAKTSVLFIPNVFTPNQDAFNTTWRIDNLEYFPKAKMKVFDRFGKIVFSTEDISKFDWNGFYNGAVLPTGTYWYILDIEGCTLRTGWILLKN